MNVLIKYRDEIKLKAKDGPKEIFALNDQLRDEILPQLGISIEDRKQGEDSVWKFVDKETLLREIYEKEEKKRR